MSEKCCHEKCGSKAARQAIAERAYYKWLEAGSPHGDGKEFWYSAEQELTHAIVDLEEIDTAAHWVEVELDDTECLSHGNNLIA
jgi:hypothetical protein